MKIFSKLASSVMKSVEDDVGRREEDKGGSSSEGTVSSRNKSKSGSVENTGLSKKKMMMRKQSDVKSNEGKILYKYITSSFFKKGKG